MSALTEFQKYTELLTDKVSKNMSPVLREQLPTKNLYHISNNAKIPVFIPQVSARTLDKEDVRVPRICTAGYLLACILGYGGMWNDFYNGKNKGWFIYGFDFDLAVRPNKRLLPDQKETGEYWLITYNKETTEYKPIRYGTLSLVQYNSVKVRNSWQFKLCLVLDTSKPVWVSEKIEVPAGKHMVIVERWRNNGEAVLSDLEVSTQPIDDATYNKLLSGKLEVLGQLTPKSANW